MKPCRILFGCFLASLGLLSGNALAKNITEFPITTGDFSPLGITRGPDGNLWFALAFSSAGGSIGRITTQGVITVFPVLTFNAEVEAITAGPDGALWFAETMANKIGRITTTGDVTEFPIPTAAPVWRPARALSSSEGPH